MENIIKKAIEGGYANDKPEYAREHLITGFEGDFRFMVIDPLFWQALSKAVNWKSWEMEEIRNNFFEENFRQEGDEPMGWNSALKYLENQL